MGSLMAGWDSPVSDPKSVTYRKNWSFTKEEIEAYWKSKKKVEEEHIRAISSPPYASQKIKVEKNLQKSSSLPVVNTKEDSMDIETESNLEKLNKNGWWRRSKWAFLNEPPIAESSANTYVSQFHVANMAASKLNSINGISA